MVMFDHFVVPAVEYAVPKFDALQLTHIELMLAQLLIRIKGKGDTFVVFDSSGAVPDHCVSVPVAGATKRDDVVSRSKLRRLRAARMTRKMWDRLLVLSGNVSTNVVEKTKHDIGERLLPSGSDVDAEAENANVMLEDERTWSMSKADERQCHANCDSANSFGE